METQLELVWVASQSTANLLRMNSQKSFTISVVLFPWQMLVQIPTAASSLSCKTNTYLILRKKLLVVVGQNRLQKSMPIKVGHLT
ncbi:Uncharacterised protein [Mycobacterium tuberculosis]|nr:Uncharacterised protein [Mycobacterium tuberculosis]